MTVDARASSAPRTGSTTEEIVVASVPASHVYVRHLAALQPDGVRRLPDPPREASAQQRWWPPVMLDPGWVEAHDFDVFHVHFGFDAWEPERLEAVADAVQGTGRRLVYTAHDLRNPHHETADLHHAQMEVLVRRADTVLTLTPGAADEIERRWGRTALVLPHPHVVEFDRMAAARPTDPDRFVVGLHLKSLRASMDPAAVLPELIRTVADIPGGVLRVDGHCDVLDPGGASYRAPLAEMLRSAHDDGALELHVHDYFTDEELWDYLESLDASVLPYRFGTHSGWLEACRDLGTHVVAPTCGYYAEQGPVHSYRMDERSYDAASLRAAVRSAYDAGPAVPVTVTARRAQRERLALAHRHVYEGTA